MKVLALDFETYPITHECVFPKPIVLSWYNGADKGLLKPNEIAHFLTEIPADTLIVAHNLKFELMVMLNHLNMEGWIHDRLDRGTFRDTLISAKLHELAKDGSLSRGFSLAALVKRYFNTDISDTKSDNSWRVRYHELDHLEFVDWPQEAIDYALDDSVWTYRLFKEHFKDADCQVSIRADFVLAQCTEKGFNVDKQRVFKMTQDVQRATNEAKQLLVVKGFAAPDKKDKTKLTKSLKKLREHVEALTKSAGQEVAYTDKGGVSTDRATLRKFDNDPVCNAFLTISNFTKLESTYLPALKHDIVRANYNVMVETGRTSSFGSDLYPSCNLQNFPRGMGVRECLVPRQGYVFVSIDYSSLELCSVAQQILNQYGFSTHATQLNSGDKPTDLHSFLGAQIMSTYTGRDITYDEFVARKSHDPEVKNYRTLAKPVGLGFPGGLGPQTMVEFASVGYGVQLSTQEATKLRDIFYATYPDFARFMRIDSKRFRTGKRKWDIDRQQAVDEYAYKVGTRIRTGCSFTNFANGFLMQSLSADGAKRAIWETYKNLKKYDGYLLNFIHDELFLELRDDENLDSAVEEISYTMIKAMQQVMPDIRITVEASVMEERWIKDGQFRYSKLFWLEPKNKRGEGQA